MRASPFHTRSIGGSTAAGNARIHQMPSIWLRRATLVLRDVVGFTKDDGTYTVSGAKVTVLPVDGMQTLIDVGSK